MAHIPGCCASPYLTHPNYQISKTRLIWQTTFANFAVQKCPAFPH